MALLQVATPNPGEWTYHLLTVSPSNVAAVVYSPNIDIHVKEDWSGSADCEYSVVTFKQPICVRVDIENQQVNHVMASSVLVTGHFEEISIKLGLDTDGKIQEEIFLRDY
jgi:hypothetical protein